MNCVRFRIASILVVLLSAAVPTTTTIASDPAAAGGTSLERIDLIDFRGRTWKLDDFQSDSILVVAMLGTECPLAKLYAIRLGEIQQQYQSQSVRVIGVMSNRQDSLEEIASFAKRQSIEFPLLKDAGNRFADQVAAERTPEVFVYDADRELRYRGRIDDQYGIGYIRDEPRRHDLRIALDELASGREVSLPQTDTVGCIIGRTKKVAEHSDVTYGGQVAEILRKRCVECHRDGEIAPFSLTDYDEVAGWSDMMAEVVREGRMPPWHASGDHLPFANDRMMSDEEKETLYAWVDAGSPKGDASELPPLPEKIPGWQLPREPDLVVPVSTESVKIPATGEVRYQYYRVDPKLDEDMWIEAAELKPGNREVVHHILAFAAPKGTRGGLDAARGFLVGYVPGARLELAPKGHAKRIPAGSELIFQVHYTPIGTEQQDQSSLGICFADPESITHEIVTTSALQPRLKIPPGEANYETSGTSPRFPAEATLLSMSPHMHVRGKSFRYELETAAGKRTTLLDIPHYDFNWQTTYVLQNPLAVPEGSRIVCTATYDNSEDNLNNPDPTATVRWGDQTWDEMMIGYYHYAVPLSEQERAGVKKPAMTLRERAEALIRNAARLQKFEQLDSDGDGKLARSDTPKKLYGVFDDLDANGDGVLTKQEVESAP